MANSERESEREKRPQRKIGRDWADGKEVEEGVGEVVGKEEQEDEAAMADAKLEDGDEVLADPSLVPKVSLERYGRSRQWRRAAPSCQREEAPKVYTIRRRKVGRKLREEPRITICLSLKSSGRVTSTSSTKILTSAGEEELDPGRGAMEVTVRGKEELLSFFWRGQRRSLGAWGHWGWMRFWGPKGDGGGTEEGGYWLREESGGLMRRRRLRRRC